jgi:hypothetical protein
MPAHAHALRAQVLATFQNALRDNRFVLVAVMVS